MSDVPRRITGTMLAPDGQPITNRTLTWYRANRRTLAQGSSVIVDEVFRTATNALGEVDVSVVPGAYLVMVRLADQDRYFEVGVPEGTGPLLMQDLIDTAAPVLTPPLLIEAQDARDAAILAKGQAETARDKAQQWAESATAPGGPSTKSAKTWAGEAAASAGAAATAAAQLPKSTLDATRAPLPTDDETQGYAPGSRWLWQGREWVLVDASAGAALWREVSLAFRSDVRDSETSYLDYSLIGDQVDQPALGGTKVNALRVHHAFGGGDTRGGRHAIYGRARVAASTAPDNPDRNYVGVQGHALAGVSDGGSAPTLADAKGALFGMSSIVGLHPGAANWLNVTGFEVNSRALAGSSVAYLSGMQVVTKDEIQGNIFDCALAISRGGVGTVGKKAGILFGNMNGSQPVAADGTLIASTGGMSVQHGIDWTSYAFTGDVLRAPNVRLSQSALTIGGVNAGLEIGSRTVPGVANIDFHTSGVNRDFDARIVASGGVAVEGTAILTYRGGEHVFDAPVRPLMDNTGQLGSTTFRWGSIFGTNIRPGSGSAIWTSGAGTPEGAVAGPVGSLYTRTDGGAGTTLYIKESGTGNTGWVAK